MSAPASPVLGRRGQLLTLAGIVLVACTLRSAVTAVSPLIERLRVDFPFGATALGLLGLLPPACFAVVGALTPAIGRRIGLERALVLSLAVTTVGTIARSFAGGAATFLGLSALTLSGMAMGNVLLPPLVKRYFPGRIGAVTAFYAVLLAVGTAVPAYLAVPTADAVGWRLSLASWAIVAAAASVPWLPRLRGGAPPDPGRKVPGTGVLRSTRARGLTAMFGMTALNFYSLSAWLPLILTDAGLSQGRAGAMLGLMAVLGIPAAVLVPPLATRVTNAFPFVVLFSACFVAGYIGLFAFPASMTALWVVLVGLGPSTFPLSLTLINVRTTTATGSSALSGMMQGIGYAVAGTGPFVVGLLHDATGGWGASFALLGASLLVLITGAWFACRPGTVEQELAARGIGTSYVPAGISPR